MKTTIHTCLLLVVLVSACGCRRDMFTQPKANPLRESKVFKDDTTARPIPAHTVANSESPSADEFDTGVSGTNEIDGFPMPVTRAVIERGRDRFEIFCAPCHGLTGNGDGMVVKRGLPRSPAFTLARLRTVPAGHFVEVIERGYGVMYPQGAQVPPDDRWAIAAYIRALQLSQYAAATNLPAGDVAKLQGVE